MKRNELFRLALYMLLIFPFIELEGLYTTFDKLNTINSLWKVLAAVVILMILVFELIVKKRQGISCMSGSYLVYMGILGLSTFLYSANIDTYVKGYLFSATLFLFADYALKHAGILWIDALYWLFSAVTIINYPFALIGGITAEYRTMIPEARIYFIDSKNKQIAIIVFAFVLTQLYFYMHKKVTIYGVITMFCATTTPFLVDSSNGKVAFLILIGLMIVPKIAPGFLKFMKYGYYLFVAIVLEFAIVIFQVQEYFAWFLVDILHKDLSFTGRVDIWNMALEAIAKRPIFGYGLKLEMFYIDTLYTTNAPVQTHCEYLQILVYGGILLMAAFLLMLFIIIPKSRGCEDKKLLTIMTSGAFCFFMMLMIDNYRNNIPFFMLLYLLYHCKDIEKQIEENGKDSQDNLQRVNIY